MNIIYADYNIYHNSIDICTYAGYILRIDCAKAEGGLKTTPNSECALNALAIDNPVKYARFYLDGTMQMQCHLLKEGIAKTFNKHSINIMSSDILKISLEFHGDLFFQYMSLSQFLCLFFGMKNRKSYFRVTLIKVSKNTLFASYFSEIGLYYLRAVTL